MIRIFLRFQVFPHLVAATLCFGPFVVADRHRDSFYVLLRFLSCSLLLSAWTCSEVVTRKAPYPSSLNHSGFRVLASRKPSGTQTAQALSQKFLSTKCPGYGQCIEIVLKHFVQPWLSHGVSFLSHYPGILSIWPYSHKWLTAPPTKDQPIEKYLPCLVHSLV